MIRYILVTNGQHKTHFDMFLKLILNISYDASLDIKLNCDSCSLHKTARWYLQIFL